MIHPDGGFLNWGYPKSWLVYKGKSMNILIKWMITRGTPMAMETSGYLPEEVEGVESG